MVDVIVTLSSVATTGVSLVSPEVGVEVDMPMVLNESLRDESKGTNAEAGIGEDEVEAEL